MFNTNSIHAVPEELQGQASGMANSLRAQKVMGYNTRL
jgi:hypothetical protein